MEDSIFTKIIKGQIPCHKIYEDEHTFAFLDIHPTCEGHTLVVHKAQKEFVWDLDPNEYRQLMGAVYKIATHYRAVSGKQFVGISVTGTDVPHNHVHIKPFNETSELHGAASTDNLAAVAKKLALV